MESEKVLQKRMYFLVNYQLSGIQAGIQSGHAAVEMFVNFFIKPFLEYKYDEVDKDLIDFALNHKTFIVLNGGTTNDASSIIPNYKGTLNQDIELLKQINYKHAIFREPDLGDVVTAVCLICDERVFNKKEYPDFYFPPLTERWTPAHSPTGGYYENGALKTLQELYEIDKNAAYQKYVEKIGIEIATLKSILNHKSKF